MSCEKRQYLQTHLRQLSLKSPGLASLLFYIRWEIGEGTNRQAPLLVGGRSITILPNFFAIPETATRMRHLLKATLHFVLRHNGRGVKLARSKTQFRPALWSLACDFAVTRMMRQTQWARVERISTELAKMLRACCRAHHLPDLEAQAAERAYDTLEFLLQEPRLPSQTRAELEHLIENQAANCTAFSDEIPSDAPTENAIWDQRLARAKHTEVPGGVLRSIQTEKTLSRIAWRRRLRAYLNASSPKSTRQAYTRPSRRYLSGVQEVFTPGREGNPIVRRLAWILDTSASIKDTTIAHFFAELEPLLSCGAEILFLTADAAVHRCMLLRGNREFASLRSQLQKRIVGLGGTRFQPALDLCRDHRVDVAIYLTDLRGTFPIEAPPFPVIWATIKAENAPKPPFGVQLSLNALE